MKIQPEKLNMIKKISLWGSICSIISVITLVLPQVSATNMQTTHGKNSPNIQAEGNVSISYGSPQDKESFNFIQHPSGGGTMLLRTPSLMNPEVVCHPEAGSRVKFLQEKNESSFMIWIKVKVVSGTCQGQIGWIGKDNYQINRG